MLDGKSSSRLCIREIQAPYDFLPVADLIELCFAATMDEDGRDFLNSLRKAGRNAQTVDWIPGMREQVSYPLQGFVWEEDHRIVGNLSLIPQLYQHQWYYLIANVAVHPDHRNKGIGRELTEHALEHIKSLGSGNAWLQVREDNPTAQRLYQKIGFQEHFRRDTWQSRSVSHASTDLTDSFEITQRRISDWPQQKTWLERSYPEEIAWNFRFDSSRFEPGFWKDINRFFSGIVHHHWALRRNHVLLGVATWEPTSHHSDFLWLGANPDGQEETIRHLLRFFFKDFISVRPVTVNYPAGEAKNAFLANGFHLQHTLIWMKYP